MTGGGVGRPRLPGGAIACALAAALFAAATLPGNRFGLAASLVFLAVMGAGVLTRRGDRPFLIAAVVLALAPLVRDAAWVVAPDMVAAFLLASLGAARAANWSAMRAALGRTFSSLAPALPALLVPLAAAISRDRVRSTLPLLRGLALGAVLLVVFGTLFVSADAAFAEVIDNTLVPDWSLGAVPERALVFALAALLAGALALSAAQPIAAGASRDAPPRLQPAEWIPALALLDLLFAAFVGVQLAVLFGGDQHVLRTAGLTYADYARHGFAELIVAAALTLVVVGVAARHAGRRDELQRRALLGLGGVLFALTLVVLASALKRLELYEEAFGFTRTRLLAHGFIFWLAGLFVLVGGCAALGWARHVPRSAVLLTAAGLVAATLANPDAMIAARNADRYSASGRIDVAYLRGLSADAVPRLATLPSDVRRCVLDRQAARLARGDELAEVNLARSRARAALAALPLSTCTR
ncbi:MAG TPA: DUF4173 domain-containing protein [Thermoleophilaceae bacterium]|jgi:hypothetical protein|nr:DUF4173 domain-containing protein [Thermoleophilaceae bacterium]